MSRMNRPRIVPPVVRPLDNRRDADGYVRSENKDTPANRDLNRSLFARRRERMLVKIMRDDMAKRGQRTN